jgi:hypothetical protein
MKKTRYTEHEMRGVYSDWQGSGLSKKVYCQSKELAISTFHYWAKKFRSEGTTSERGFVELDLSQPQEVPLVPKVEIEYPSGVKLRFYREVEVNWLKTLI